MAKAKKKTTTPPAQHLVQTETFIDEHATMANARNPFGDGHAAERIVASLIAD